MGVDEQNLKLKLYIRLPVRIKDEQQVKELHPDIDSVTLPRQAARWCVATFPDKETLQKVRAELKGKQVNGKKIFCGPCKKPKGRTTKKQKAAVQPESLLELIK